VSSKIIPRGKDYLKLSKGASCYVKIPNFENSNLNSMVNVVNIGRKIKEAVRIIDNIIKFEKFSKLKTSYIDYIEYDKFADSDLHQGYFCYNSIYWINSQERQVYVGQK
jgi:hypothetical protein